MYVSRLFGRRHRLNATYTVERLQAPAMEIRDRFQGYTQQILHGRRDGIPDRVHLATIH